ncbi:MAG: hypothetical protein F6K17_38130 [Okeania sp. SIO3C4]|nr:hypothetical protein [Okeania sp. SIO3C4]
MLNQQLALTLLGFVIALPNCHTPTSTTHFGAHSLQAALPAPVETNQRSTDMLFAPADLDQTAPQSASIIAQAQDGIRTERVQFAPGTTGMVIEDSIQGYEAVDYLLNARAGQYMAVNLMSDNGANYFTILTPPGAEVDRLGSVSQSQYQGTLPASGDYRIRVYIMRNAARRNESANYRLEMSIADQDNAESAPGVSKPEDALVPGTNYNATGEIPYAITQTEPNGSCPSEVSTGS